VTFDGNRGFAPRRGLKTLLATAVLALPLWSGTALAQSDQDRAAARSLATQGSESFKAGKYDETIDLLTRAEGLVHAPTHLLLIARAQVASGKLVLGKETYLKITREQLAGDAPPAFKQAQESATKELAALEPRIGAVRISLGGDAAGVEVTIDGKPLSTALVGVFTPMDPGKHKISAARKGGKPVDKELVIADGEKKELTLEMGTLATTATPPVTEPLKPVEPATKDEPTPAKSDDGFTGMQIGGLVAAGVGVAGAAVGVVFVLGRSTAQSDSDALFSACNPGCTTAEKSEIDDLDNDAASKGTIGVIGLAAGGALIATGVTLFVLGGNKDSKPKTGLQVSPWVSTDSAGVYGTF
jgi:hypothetical protein